MLEAAALRWKAGKYSFYPLNLIINFPLLSVVEPERDWRLNANQCQLKSASSIKGLTMAADDEREMRWTDRDHK